MSALEALRAGRIVLLNTDTLPGLHGSAREPGMAEALARQKQSPAGRPFLLLFASVEDALVHGSCAHAEDEPLLRRAWPGPVTALLAPTPRTPTDWVHEGRSIAARVPEPPALRALIEALGAPLYSTSANRSAEPPATDLAAARALFPELVAEDLGLVPGGAASTVVDLTQPGGVLLRQGSAPWPPPLPGALDFPPGLR